jgi:hypothetical protein
MYNYITLPISTYKVKQFKDYKKQENMNPNNPFTTHY